MKKKYSLIFFLFSVFTFQAQETILASGGEAVGSGGSISYSVGQLLYTINTGATGSVSHGVQQNIETITLSNPEVTEIILTAKTYPNPTADKIILAINDFNLEAISYNLYDINARKLKQGLVQQASTTISLEQFSSGVYILKITQNNLEIKTFKIIKK